MLGEGAEDEAEGDGAGAAEVGGGGDGGTGGCGGVGRRGDSCVVVASVGGSGGGDAEGGGLVVSRHLWEGSLGGREVFTPRQRA